LVLSDDIFSRLEGMPLVDKYAVYQLLDDEWTSIAIDLEILQTEGFEASRKVDPRMVVRREEEVQDGWRGRVIPFELIEKTLLKAEYEQLHSIEDRVSEINATYEELLDSLSEEEKDSDAVNDAKDAFVAAWIAKQAKRLLADKKKGLLIPEDTFEAKIITVNALMSEEKQLKSKLRLQSAELQTRTKNVIENLSDDENRFWQASIRFPRQSSMG